MFHVFNRNCVLNTKQFRLLARATYARIVYPHIYIERGVLHHFTLLTLIGLISVITH